MADLSDIRSYLSYDPDSGDFVWLKPTSNMSRYRAGDRAGCVGPDGYCSIRYFGKRYQAHRLAWFIVHGLWPDLIDHINGEKADNRIANLRLATKSQNAGNMRARSSLGKGVRRAGAKFMASVKCDGKNYYLGVYETPEEAHEAYCVAAREVFGEFARTE